MISSRILFIKNMHKIILSITGLIFMQKKVSLNILALVYPHRYNYIYNAVLSEVILPPRHDSKFKNNDRKAKI